MDWTNLIYVNKYLRSGCGSAIAARRNPGYLLHMASTSCLVIVGAKLRKKIEVVLCKARGLGLPKMEKIINTYILK